MLQLNTRHDAGEFEALQWKFGTWRSLNLEMVEALEADATDLANPEWLERVKRVAAEFCQWAGRI